MKLTLFRILSVAIAITSLNSCKTLTNSSVKEDMSQGPAYTRVWAGYRRRDITLAEFQKQMNNIPRDVNLNWQATPESWTSVEKLTRTKPDVVAISHFDSRVDYQNSPEVSAMWSIFEAGKTISDQPVPFTNSLAAGQTYFLTESTSSWNVSGLMPILVEATGNGFLESMTVYLQNANSSFKKCSLNVATVACEADFCSFWVDKKFSSCGAASFATDIQNFAHIVSP